MERTTSTFEDEAAASEMHQQSIAAAPLLGVVGGTVYATDRRGTMPISLQPRKKRKVEQRKPPPVEPTITASEESFGPTPMDAQAYAAQGMILPGTGYNIPQTEAHAATIPIPPSRLVTETPRLPMTDWMPPPLEYTQPSSSSRRQRTYSDLVAASQHTESLPQNYSGAISVIRQPRDENYHPQFQQMISPPRGSIFPNSMPHQPGTPALYASNTFRSAGVRSRTSRANYLDLPGSQAALAAVVPNSIRRRQHNIGFHTSDLAQFTPARFIGENSFSLQEDPHFTFAASSQGASTSHSINSAEIGMPSEFMLSRTANEILEDMLRGQQLPQPYIDIPQALDQVGSTSVGQQRLTEATTIPTIPLQLPAIMGQPNDVMYMNDHLIYLRQQIEFFGATQDDLDGSTRGRNRWIHVGQVGIRCRHCAHVPAAVRQNGSMYFPRTIQGLYQAAQNMGTNHIQCGLCTEMADSVKTKFIDLLPSKNLGSRDGARRYWEESAKRQGLVDTEHGIAFQPESLTETRF